MPMIGDTLSDGELSDLIKQHGLDAATRLGSLPQDATDEQIRGALSTTVAPSPSAPAAKNPQQALGETVQKGAQVLSDSAKRFAQGAVDTFKQPAKNLYAAYTGDDPYGINNAQGPLDVLKSAGKAAMDVGTLGLVPAAAIDAPVIGPLVGLEGLLVKGGLGPAASEAAIRLLAGAKMGASLAGTMGAANAAHVPEISAAAQALGDKGVEALAKKLPNYPKTVGLAALLDSAIEPATQLGLLHGATQLAGAGTSRPSVEAQPTTPPVSPLSTLLDNANPELTASSPTQPQRSIIINPSESIATPKPKADAAMAQGEELLAALRANPPKIGELTRAQKSVLDKTGLTINRPIVNGPMDVSGFQKSDIDRMNEANDIASQQALPEPEAQGGPSNFNEKTGEWEHPLQPLVDPGLKAGLRQNGDAGPAYPEPASFPVPADARFGGPLDGLLGPRVSPPSGPALDLRIPNKIEEPTDQLRANLNPRGEGLEGPGMPGQGGARPARSTPSPLDVAKAQRESAAAEEAQALADKQTKPAPGTVEPKLPRGLAGAKPRWRDSNLKFESDVDKALYIIANTKNQSKSHAEYMNYLKGVFPGKSEFQLQMMGKPIREAMKGHIADWNNAGEEYQAENPSVPIPSSSTWKPKEAVAPSLQSLVQSTIPGTDGIFSLIGDKAKSDALEEMQANQPEAFKRQMEAEQARQQTKPEEGNNTQQDLLAPDEPDWKRAGFNSEAEYENAPQWKREGFDNKSDYDNEVYKAKDEMRKEMNGYTGGITPVKDFVKGNGGFSIDGAKRMGLGEEFSKENMGGDGGLANNGRDALPPEQQLQAAKDANVVPSTMDLNAFIDEIRSELARQEAQLSKDGNNYRAEEAAELKRQRSNATRGDTRGIYNNNNERGAVELGKIADDATALAQATSKALYNPAKDVMPNGEIPSLEQHLGLVGPGETPDTSRLAKIFRGASTAVTKAFTPILRPETVAPKLINQLRAIWRAKNSDYVEPLKQTIQLIDKGVGGLLKFYKGEISQDALNSIRDIENLDPGAKVFVTNGKVVSLALDGKIDPRTLPPMFQRAYEVAKGIYQHIADSEGILPENRMNRYFTHLITDPKILNMLRAFKEKTGYEWTQDGNAAFIADPYLKERLGISGYTLDLERAMNARIDSSAKKIYQEPAGAIVDAYIANLEKSPGNSQIADYLKRFRDENVLGKASSGFKAFDDVVGSLTSDKLRDAVAKADKGELIRFLRDRGFIDGELSNALPQSGWSKSLIQNVGTALHTAYLGWNPATIARDSWNRFSNTAASEGLANTVKGYTKFFSEDVFKRAVAAANGEKYTSEWAKSGIPHNFTDNIAGGYELANSRGLRKRLQNLELSPLQISFIMDNGGAYYAAKFKAAQLAERGAFPKDAFASDNYAQGVISKTVFGHGPLETSPFFNHPLTAPLRIFADAPQRITGLWVKLWNSPTDARIAGIPVGFLRMMAIQGIMANTALHKMGVDTEKWTGSKNTKILGQTISVPGVGVAREAFNSMSPFGGRYEGGPGIQLYKNAAKVAGSLAQLKFDKNAKEGLHDLLRTGADAAGGAFGYPGAAVNKSVDALNELQTGVARRGETPWLPTPGKWAKRTYAYSTNPANTLLKQVNLSGHLTNAYKEALEKSHQNFE